MTRLKFMKNAWLTLPLFDRQSNLEQVRERRVFSSKVQVGLAIELQAVVHARCNQSCRPRTPRHSKSRSKCRPLPLNLGTVPGFATGSDLVRPIGGQPLAKCGRWSGLGGLPLDSFRYKSAAGPPGRGGGGAPDWPRWSRGTFNDVAAQSWRGAKGHQDGQ